MAVNAHISGDFLDIYPYMNWIFLLTQEGDLLLARTEELISDKPLHDFLFRQSEEADQNFTPPELSLEFGIDSFKKIAKIADMFSFADMRFFYSNIIYGANNGLYFSSFDTRASEVSQIRKITDAPISSISAKFMTVFGASLEAGVTTLYGVENGNYARSSEGGPLASRVGVSDDRIYYYFGSSNIEHAQYERSIAQSENEWFAEEVERESIVDIKEVEPYSLGDLEPDFVFNANGGVFLKKGKRLIYRKNGVIKPFEFSLDIEGKIIRAHLLAGKRCFESLTGLFSQERNQLNILLDGECINSRGYSNSKNFKNMIGAVNDSGAHLFKI